MHSVLYIFFISSDLASYQTSVGFV